MTFLIIEQRKLLGYSKHHFAKEEFHSIKLVIQSKIALHKLEVKIVLYEKKIVDVLIFVAFNIVTTKKIEIKKLKKIKKKF